MEKQRLREIALEFKQSGAFASITQQLHEQSMPLIPTFPTFTPMIPIAQPEIHQNHHHPQQQFAFSTFTENVQRPKLEPSKAFLEAVAASQRINASKNFTEMFGCGNSNDSTSNGQINEDSSNSSKLMELKMILFCSVYEIHWNKFQFIEEEDGALAAAAAALTRERKKRSRWGGSENDKTFIPGMPTILPPSLDANQQEAYLGNYINHFDLFY